MKKRVLSLLLCICMVLPWVSNVVPALIANAAELHVLDFGTFEKVASTNEGDTLEYGGYFTIIYGSGGKIEQQKTYSYDDGYTGTLSLSFGGTSKELKSGAFARSIQFTTKNTATVTIWWYTGSDNRSVAIYNSSLEVIDGKKESSAKNTPVKSVFSIDAAGTYHIGLPDGNVYIFKVEVTENTSGSDPVCEHTNHENVLEVPATCKTPGTTAGVVCADCGAVISGCEEIPVVAHTFDIVAGTGKCVNCGADCEHSYSGNACTICGMLSDGGSHAWGEPRIISEPTCIRAGAQEKTCTVCDTTVVEILPAGHNYDPETHRCTNTGGALKFCGAYDPAYDPDHAYMIDFEEELESFENEWIVYSGQIRTAKDSAYTVVYNGYAHQAYLKMNKQFSMTLKIPANPTDGSFDYDGIVIMVAVSRGEGGTTNKLTTLEVNGVELGVPRDGILVFGVKAGTTYTIVQDSVENPLFHIEYIPGAQLVVSSEEDHENAGGSAGDSGNDEVIDDGTHDGIISMAASITANKDDNFILSQHSTLTGAVNAAKNGQHVWLLETNDERLVAGAPLAVGESFTIHTRWADNISFEGTIDPSDEGVTITYEPDGCIVVTRTAPAPSEEPQDEYVAQNVQTQQMYTSVSAALEAAADGQEIVLLKNASAKYVIIPVGVTLNLKSFELTADYVVGFNGSFITADRFGSASYGKLIVEKDHVVLGETAYYATNREVLPVWDEEQNGYVFVKLGIGINHAMNILEIDDGAESGESSIRFVFAHECADAPAERYLVDTERFAESGITFVVRLTWTIDKGTAYQDFVYNADLVAKVAASKITSEPLCFEFILFNYEELGIDISTLTVTAMLISDTGVEAVGETYQNGEV